MKNIKDIKNRVIKIDTDDIPCFGKVKDIRTDKPSFGYVDILFYWVSDTNDDVKDNVWCLVEPKNIHIIE